MKEIPAHIRGLQSELDSGCDDVASILADALEDEGDSDAASVFRIVVAQGYRPGRKGVTSFWVRDDMRLSPAGVPKVLFARLYLGQKSEEDFVPTFWYLRRSLAYADLGSVLLTEPKEE